MEDIVTGPPHLNLARSAIRWWIDLASREGRKAASLQLVTTLWGFLRDSTPERRRQRFGDAEFDWDHRVNTTSGAVGWRDRLLGLFHSPYQPTDAALFHEMMAALQREPAFDFRDFIFLDLGSGKGRALLMAADYPFCGIFGVELLSSLHCIAIDNLAKYKSESQKCFLLRSICGDATEFALPAEPLVIFLFNPFPEDGLRKLIARLEQNLHENPRSIYVLYHNPLLEHLLIESAKLRKVAGTHQYSLFSSR